MLNLALLNDFELRELLLKKAKFEKQLDNEMMFSNDDYKNLDEQIHLKLSTYLYTNFQKAESPFIPKLNMEKWNEVVSLKGAIKREVKDKNFFGAAELRFKQKALIESLSWVKQLNLYYSLIGCVKQAEDVYSIIIYVIREFFYLYTESIEVLESEIKNICIEKLVLEIYNYLEEINSRTYESELVKWNEQHNKFIHKLQIR